MPAAAFENSHRFDFFRLGTIRACQEARKVESALPEPKAALVSSSNNVRRPEVGGKGAFPWVEAGSVQARLVNDERPRRRGGRGRNGNPLEGEIR